MALTGYELTSIEEIDAAITVRGASATTADVYELSLPYPERALAAVAARRASAGLAVQAAVTDISSVEILALHSSPVQVVPAQGVGTVVVPSVLSTQFKFVSAAYTVSADVEFIYGTDTTDVIAKLGVDLTVGHSQFGINGARPLLQDFVNLTLTDLENQPIKLIATSANPTLGDSVLRMVVQYFVFELA